MQSPRLPIKCSLFNLIPVFWIAATTHYFQAKLLRRDRKPDHSTKFLSRCKSTRQNSCVVALSPKETTHLSHQQLCLTTLRRIVGLGQEIYHLQNSQMFQVRISSTIPDPSHHCLARRCLAFLQVHLQVRCSDLSQS